MGEKNKKNNEVEQHKEGAENKKIKDNGGGGGGGKNKVTVVLKADLHCQGCVSKVLKCIRSFDGVDAANIGDEQRITVVGKMDPVKLREKVEQKTHKKVELISPQPKKDNNKESAKGKENSGSDNAKQEKNKKESKDKNSKNKSDEKKSKEKEPPVTTAALKMHLHCDGCIQKIYKTVTKTKGCQDVKIDRQKELVTVTGAMDMKALAELLKKHLKKDVELVPPKKEGEKKEKENGGGDKAKSGGDKVKSGGDKGRSGGSGDGDGDGDGGAMAAGEEKMEGNRVQFQVGYPYPIMYGPGAVVEQFHYNPYAFGPYHAPQMFSDENPNACSVM